MKNCKATLTGDEKRLAFARVEGTKRAESRYAKDFKSLKYALKSKKHMEEKVKRQEAQRVQYVKDYARSAKDEVGNTQHRLEREEQSLLQARNELRQCETDLLKMIDNKQRANHQFQQAKQQCSEDLQREIGAEIQKETQLKEQKQRELESQKQTELERIQMEQIREAMRVKQKAKEKERYLLYA